MARAVGSWTRWGLEQVGAPPLIKLAGQEPQAPGCNCSCPAMAPDPGIPALLGAQEALAPTGLKVFAPSAWAPPTPGTYSWAEQSCNHTQALSQPSWVCTCLGGADMPASSRWPPPDIGCWRPQEGGWEGAEGGLAWACRCPSAWTAWVPWISCWWQ